MKTEKMRIAGCMAAFIIFICFLWQNILVLDDFHPSHEEILQTYINTEESHPMQQYNLNNNPISKDNSSKISIAGQQNAQVSSAPDISQYNHHIYINLDIMKLYVYKNSELVKTYPCSGGRKDTPSPLGTWKIVAKDEWDEGFGGAWLEFNVPWGKFGIHGTIYPWFIGKSNQSKGCIRMLNKDVKELYKIVPLGTTVTIVYKSRPFRTIKYGYAGSDVMEVQQALKALGYYHETPDGIFGSMLKSSVQEFQKNNNIYPDGVVNKQTYGIIMKKLVYQEKQQ